MEKNGHNTKVGLIADPDYPTTVAERVAEGLTDTLAEQFDGEWSIEVVTDPITAGTQGTDDMLIATARERERRGWDYAVCITDLPMRDSDTPVLAAARRRDDVAVIALPTLGGAQPFRRTRKLLLELLDELTGSDEGSGPDDHRMHSGLTSLVGPIRRQVITGDSEDASADGSGEGRSHADVRYATTPVRGRIRLLTGMVRGNRPWRMLSGLSSAMAAAMATAVFGVVSSTVWQIGDALGPGRQLAIAAGAIALMTGWLILGHGLWERRRQGGGKDQDREQMVLYNASTVVTLAIGVICMYVVMFLLILLATWFVIDTSLMDKNLSKPSDWTSYVGLAWITASMGIVGGALGSGLESDRAVRQAAYGFREEQRRSQLEREQDQAREEYRDRAADDPER